jgi:hypothetical protein
MGQLRRKTGRTVITRGDYILSLDTEHMQSCRSFFKSVRSSNHIEFAVRLTIPTTTTTTTKTTAKINIMSTFFSRSKTSRRIPFITFRNVDIVEETSLASSSEFDDSEIMSITDSMHLAKDRGVRLSVEHTFYMGDEDLIECDSVHLTRQRVPECVWHEDDKNEDCDEFAEESPLHQAKPSSRESNSSTPTVRFGRKSKKAKKVRTRSLQKKSRRMIPVMES